MKQKITFIGLGRMGSAMASQILQAGFKLTVYNRTIEKAKALEGLGAHVSESLEAAVADADIVFTSLIDDKALTSVSKKMLPKLKKGAIHVSTSMILPKTAKQLEAQHQSFDSFYVAAPVLGVPKTVKTKKATTMCSGDQDSIEMVVPLLNAYSGFVQNLGSEVTHANVFKICMNYSTLTAMELISELYVFSEKSGLDTAIIQEALHHVYAHPYIKLYIDKIHARDFDQVNFDMRGGNKDVELFQKAFLNVGVTPDIANMLHGKFTEALENGMADKDWSAVSDIVRYRSGLK